MVLGKLTKAVWWRINFVDVALQFLLLTGAMGEGLSEKFSRLQNEERSHAEISLALFKDMFFPEPPPPPEPTKLKVFGAGLPRSGTGSLALALTTLGYKPCHGPGTFALASVLGEHYAGRASKWDLIRRQEELGYDVQGLDQLSWKNFEEAAQMPNVKVILSQHPRGGAGWAASWSSFAPDHIHYFGQRPFRFTDTMVQLMKLNREFLTYLGGSDDPTDSYFAFPAPGLSDAYERHNEAVKKAVPAERLLVFDPTQGWEPICRFLEVEQCPTTEYPRMTDRQMMLTMSKVWLVITWIWPLIPVAAIALPVLLVRFFFCRGTKTKTA